ncbi:potassium channel family protein [Arthrobacter sp. Helios]|uniref:potassium channel family protein n=1 Tax=Arthrobacter sp. Helios TaxID=2828862 RepID=UPI00205F0E2E|nr:potassium channel family protein [Arthrobacter sp. Helios]UPO78669.1 ion channel [Arthrobacter sp. Helios]
MKRVRVLWHIIRITGADVFVFGFLIVYGSAALILPRFEPGIPTVGDSLWYLFVSFTTIGFGDFVAVTLIGRLITVFVALYGILVVALATGVIVGFYNELLRARTKDSLREFISELEQLPDLTKEQLADLAARVKERHILG